ncbi:MAG: hypothetical protein WA738_20015 [Candidatus Angelobacter sp.]
MKIDLLSFVVGVAASAISFGIVCVLRGIANDIKKSLRHNKERHGDSF